MSNITVSKSEKIESAVKMFIANQDINENSKITYYKALKQFFNYCQSRGKDVSGLNRADVIQYKEYMLNTAKRKPLTVRGYVAILRKFYTFIEAETGAVNIAKDVTVKRITREPRKHYLTIAEQKRLLAAALESGSLRDYAIINLMLRSGLRTVEVIRLNISSIKQEAGHRVLMIHGKGHREADTFVKLTDKAFTPISEYLTKRGNVSEAEPLFTADSNRNRGERLTTQTISKMVKHYLRAIGINDSLYTAHSLRHTAAVTLLKAGATLMETQYHLRHANPATTQLYLLSMEREARLENSAADRIDSAI